MSCHSGINKHKNALADPPSRKSTNRPFPRANIAVVFLASGFDPVSGFQHTLHCDHLSLGCIKLRRRLQSKPRAHEDYLEAKIPSRLQIREVVADQIGSREIKSKLRRGLMEQ